MRPRLDAFLETKLAPPATRSAWIPRDDLIEQLERATSNCALTLLAAPAGYGKTTLIAQWLASLTGRRSAFVALDADDLDPVRLWTHIVTALQRAGCVFADTPTRLVAASGTDLIKQLLPTVVNAVAGLGQPLVLVLDDYHFVTSDDCHEQISFLLQHLPPAAALVISTRVDPALRLGRLRIAHQLAEIRADQLRFGLDSTPALLASEHIQLSTPAVTDLLQRTEGWPAGLYLATLSLSDVQTPTSSCGEFTRRQPLHRRLPHRRGAESAAAATP